MNRDSAAVLGLFEMYYDRVYCFARRSLDPSAAEDIAQEVFTKLLGVEGVADREISCSYLIKVADNLIKRRYRRARRFDSYVSETASEQNYLPRQTAVREEVDAEPVTKHFDCLTDREQEALRLIVCQGLSYEEAAAALGVKVTAVNNWKHRGIKHLRGKTSEVAAA